MLTFEQSYHDALLSEESFIDSTADRARIKKEIKQLSQWLFNNPDIHSSRFVDPYKRLKFKLFSNDGYPCYFVSIPLKVRAEQSSFIYDLYLSFTVDTFCLPVNPILMFKPVGSKNSDYSIIQLSSNIEGKALLGIFSTELLQ